MGCGFGRVASISADGLQQARQLHAGPLPGETLYGAVTDKGAQSHAEFGVVVQSLKEKPTGRSPQCFAPVTTVALVTAVV